MEFLLINHPLDCPICDQGGECELQDLAMGFGRDISRYTERKRVVKDKNLGPLVSTDMTRCIHCTRCVRFGQEIAGIQELGTIGRGERMQISTFIEKSVDHELSGNIIDLCPVGALNNKPYRYRARAWEMTQHPLVSPHDCVGTNLYGHVLRGRLMRVVPRANEAINETWIADRDRFSCEGIYADDRARQADGQGGRRVARGRLGDRARGRGRRAAEGRSRARRQPGRRARVARSVARGRLPRGARRPRARLGEHRPPAASRRLPRPGGRSARADARLQHRRARAGLGAAAGRLQPAPGGADHRAPDPQGRPASRHAGRVRQSAADRRAVPGRGAA